ncbi:MAG: pimeloyl-[acyl-carrier protein] methyl ester esterase [marine bacterium B5-7]|nr:MAG: pimeloyl-[acyl-carrier protein] methyl ester esterase [marine bacterium B5-7]
MDNKQKLNCILLHGWGINRTIWGGLSSRLNSFDSIDNICLYTIAEEVKASGVDALASYLKDRVKNNTVIVAWSFGGLVATRLASFSNKIKAIVYIASPPCFINTPDWNNVLDTKSISELQRNLLNNPKKTIEYFAGLVAHGDEDVKKTIKTIKPCLAEEKDRQVLSFWLKELLEQDQRKIFSALNIPIQHLLAEHDALISPEIINQLKQLRPQMECEVIKNSCHAPFVGRPQEIINSIDGFISARLK